MTLEMEAQPLTVEYPLPQTPTIWMRIERVRGTLELDIDTDELLLRGIVLPSIYNIGRPQPMVRMYLSMVVRFPTP